MWVAALVGGIFAAALVPTITVYGPELFPTSLRGRANGLVSMTAMGGSVVGLVAAGRLHESLGSFGSALGVLAVAPLLMAAIVLALFPETARRELEDLNPEDRDRPGTAEVTPVTAGHPPHDRPAAARRDRPPPGDGHGDTPDAADGGRPATNDTGGSGDDRPDADGAETVASG
jgi:MFS family permease